MSYAALVRDKESNLRQAAVTKEGKFTAYEFAFPFENSSLEDSSWQLGKVYQIAVLVGPGEKFRGIDGNTWMSDQIHIRLGSASPESIYHPPYLAGQEDMKGPRHTHGPE